MDLLSVRFCSGSLTNIISINSCKNLVTWVSLSLFYRWGKWGTVKLKTLAKDHRTSKWNNLLIPFSSQISVFHLWLSSQGVSWQIGILLHICSRWPVFSFGHFSFMANLSWWGKASSCFNSDGLGCEAHWDFRAREGVREGQGWPGPKGVSCCFVWRPKQIIQNWHSQDLAWVVSGAEAEPEGLEKGGPHIPQMKLRKRKQHWAAGWVWAEMPCAQ